MLPREIESATYIDVTIGEIPPLMPRGSEREREKERGRERESKRARERERERESERTERGQEN